MKAAVRFRLLAFLVIGLLAVGQAGARYAGLFEIVRPTTFAIDVHLPESGGLFDRAEVTFRGVTVGRVSKLEFRRSGVIAHLAIDKKWRIPRDLQAEVHNRSAVGEQYLDLVPQSDGGPFLSAGEQVGSDRTMLPVSDEELLVTLDDFLKSIDTDDLATVVHELGTAFGGSAADLETLIDGGAVLIQRANESLPETKTLLTTTGVVLRTQQNQAQIIATYLGDLSEASQVIHVHDGDLRSILHHGSGAAAQTALLLEGIAPDLRVLLTHLTDLSGIASQRVNSIEETLVAIPYALASAQTPGRDGRAHFALDDAQSPAPCRVGYVPAGKWRSPSDSTFIPLDDRIGCDEPLSVVPRGSASVLRKPSMLNRAIVGGAGAVRPGWARLMMLPLLAP